MSKKTVTFRSPSRQAVALVPVEAASAEAPTEAAVDRWIHRQDETVVPAPIGPEAGAPTALTISISAEPDWFEVIKLWFLLPYLTFSFWTLGAAQRNARHFPPRTHGGKGLFE